MVPQAGSSSKTINSTADVKYQKLPINTYWWNYLWAASRGTQPLPLIRWNILWIQPDLLITAPCFLFIWTDPLKDDSLFVKEASSVTVRMLFKRLNEGETSPASLKTLLNIIHVSLLNVLMHHSTCRRAATAPVSRKTQRIHESNRSKHSV